MDYIFKTFIKVTLKKSVFVKECRFVSAATRGQIFCQSHEWGKREIYGLSTYRLD